MIIGQRPLTRRAISDAADLHPLARCYQRLVAANADAKYWLQLAHHYSYVLPEPHLVVAIAQQSPLVEVAAGTGYWAYLLRQHGADIIAYDHAPIRGGRQNRYHSDTWHWFDVLEADAHAAAARHSERTLLLCWPPLYSSLWDVLRSYAGDRVVMIGDGGFRTARVAGLEDAFDLIERWDVIALDPEPRSSPCLTIWTRKKALQAAATTGGLPVPTL